MDFTLNDEQIQELTAKHAEEWEIEAAVKGMLKGYFRPEFLNRIDETIVFHPLGREQLTRIVDVQLENLRRRLMTRSLKLAVTDGAKTLLADEGYDPQFGARPLKRVIQQRVENPLAAKILRGEFAEGDTIRADVDAKRNDFVFEKGRELYGLYQARRAIRDAGLPIPNARRLEAPVHLPRLRVQGKEGDRLGQLLAHLGLLIGELDDVLRVGQRLAEGGGGWLANWGWRLASATETSVPSNRSSSIGGRGAWSSNPRFRRRLEECGLRPVGTSPDDRLVEFVELDGHPFWIGTQAHPEFKSRPDRPHPLFKDFVGASLVRAGTDLRVSEHQDADH